MYIRPKKVFWTLVLLAALLYAGAHLAIRSAWVRARVLDWISARTGCAASASGIRFTPGLAFLFEDFRLERPASGGTAAATVAEAKWLRLGLCRGGWFVRASGPVRLEAFRDADGVWTPPQADGAEECPGACVFSRVSSAFGNLYFELPARNDIRVTFADGAKTTAFSGVAWTRVPVRIPGRPDAVQNRLSWLRGPVGGEVTPDLAAGGSDEWYELPGGVARLVPFGPPPGPRPDAGVIGGDDGPTSIWIESSAPPSKEDMVEAFREFFETDPETAKAFFDAAREATQGEEKPPAENAEPAPAPEEPRAESAENAEPAPAPEEPRAESAEPAPAPEEPRAEPAEPAPAPAEPAPPAPPAGKEMADDLVPAPAAAETPAP